VDPHDYQASARQIAALHKADLVIANGLLLEEGLIDVLDAAAGDGANVVELGPLLDPIPFSADGSAAGFADPHVWMDPLRMATAAHLVADQLTAIDGSIDWSTRADAYDDELVDADVEIDEALAAIPAEQRKLVTNHDSLGYLADRYGFEIVGVVIPGGSTLASPSSAELADLVAEIEREGVPAIFTETSSSPALAEAVAKETAGAVAVVELYSGSLGEPGSGAESLIGLLKTNAARIRSALS
jgi:zinc/manganese transport system substrate-binding protein